MTVQHPYSISPRIREDHPLEAHRQYQFQEVYDPRRLDRTERERTAINRAVLGERQAAWRAHRSWEVYLHRECQSYGKVQEV